VYSAARRQQRCVGTWYSHVANHNTSEDRPPALSVRYGTCLRRNCRRTPGANMLLTPTAVNEQIDNIVKGRETEGRSVCVCVLHIYMSIVPTIALSFQNGIRDSPLMSACAALGVPTSAAAYVMSCHRRPPPSSKLCARTRRLLRYRPAPRVLLPFFVRSGWRVGW